jgi:hypothetical protein
VSDIKSAIGAIILIILIATGVFSFLLDLTGEFMKLILWLFQLSLTDFGLSPFVEIGIKSLTFVLSYALVGILFNALGFFDSDIMKFVYFVVSTLIGFALSAVIMFLQENIIIISWSIFGIFMVTVIAIVTYKIKKKALKE